MTPLVLTFEELMNAGIPALYETLIMVSISSVGTVLLGLPLGVLLYISQPSGIAPNPFLAKGLGAVVNATRSVPYAILMLSLIPLTRLIVGSSVGPLAACVSLIIAAVPFFARLVETSLREVHPGKVDAAHAMGSTRMQTVTKVLLPEALPSLVASVTTTVVALIGYSAMAGLIGGGGLGRMAYNYGFQRFDSLVMIIIVLVLLGMVQLIQVLGDTVTRRVDHR
ncbi:MAG: methionine ABC transporter permease [Propionibacteriaceae bacterium]|nr:methionine ABC transporter permease [Propionibacteriaceae bacterium]